MDLDKILSNIQTPTVRDPMAPKREIALSNKDEIIVCDSIDKLDSSNTDKNKLFEIFNDWQTKRTLTTKRVFMSTSLIVAAASWVNIDYLELSFFGLKVANGNPTRFIIFVLTTIILSGIFYEISRRIDKSVRYAKIKNIPNYHSS